MIKEAYHQLLLDVELANRSHVHYKHVAHVNFKTKNLDTLNLINCTSTVHWFVIGQQYF